jgi:hypothetical protein
MSMKVDLITFSTKPLRLVHESQFIVMMLQPGAMDLSIAGAPTERFEYGRHCFMSSAFRWACSKPGQNPEASFQNI